jgi:transketolase C-terminal domain/subunit
MTIESNINSMSDAFHNVLAEAVKANYRMVEFDCDATEHDEFETFDY